MEIKSENNIRYYSGDITPGDNIVMVFGSNPEGRHGAGAAKIAREQFGAVYGQGEGLQGNAYALPTKDLRVKENRGFRSISPEAITENIKRLYQTARENPGKSFCIAYRNTDRASLNGYTGIEMMQMFAAAGPLPENILVSEEWYNAGKEILSFESVQRRDRGQVLTLDELLDSHAGSIRQYVSDDLATENLPLEEVIGDALSNTVRDALERGDNPAAVRLWAERAMKENEMTEEQLDSTLGKVSGMMERYTESINQKDMEQKKEENLQEQLSPKQSLKNLLEEKGGRVVLDQPVLVDHKSSDGFDGGNLGDEYALYAKEFFIKKDRIFAVTGQVFAESNELPSVYNKDYPLNNSIIKEHNIVQEIRIALGESPEISNAPQEVTEEATTAAKKENTANTVVIYHSRDWDGWTSGELAREAEQKADPNAKIDTVGWTYGDALPDVSGYDKVILVDLTISEKTEQGPDYSWMKENAGKLFWIDHHRNAIEALPELKDVPGLRNTDGSLSACRLAWAQYHPGEEEPLHVKYVGISDVQKHDDPEFSNAADYSLYLNRTYGRDVTLDIARDAMSADIGKVLEKGREFEKERAAHEEEVWSKGVLIEHEGRKGILLANCEQPSVVLKNHLINSGDIDFVVLYQPLDGHEGQYKCSVRVPDGKDFDGAAYAAQWGGGGHRAAAGWTFDESELNRISNSANAVENGQNMDKDYSSDHIKEETEFSKLANADAAKRFANGFFTPQEIKDNNIPREKVIGLLNDSKFELEGEWPNLEFIKGDVSIKGHVKEHVEFPKCRYIGGNVWVFFTTANFDNCHIVKGNVWANYATVNLGNCHRVEGNVWTCGDNATINLDNCLNIDGNVQADKKTVIILDKCEGIKGNVIANNTTLDLSNCHGIGKNISANGAVVNATRCQRIKGNVSASGDNTVIVLDNCHTVDGNVYADKNTTIKLDKCENIGKSISVHETAELVVPSSVLEQNKSLSENTEALPEKNHEEQPVLTIETPREYISNLQGQLFENSQRIEARPAEPGEEITTILADGTKETPEPNIAKEGDLVVNNVGSPEQWIVTGENFRKKYQKDPDHPGQFMPIGIPMYVVKVNTDFKLTAPWGKEQFIKAGGYLLQDPTNPADVYGIGKDEFNKTYQASSASKLVAVMKDEEKLKMAKDGNTRPEFLSELAQDALESIRTETARNNATPIESLLTLRNDRDKSVSEQANTTLENRMDEVVRYIESQDISPEQFAELAETDNLIILSSIARKINAPAGMLQKFAESALEPVRLEVAGNSATPLESLLLLRNDKEKSISEQANAALKNKADEVVKYIETRDISPEQFAEFAQIDSLLIQSAIARNVNAPAEVLGRLAQLKNLTVSLALARNTGTPEEILQEFSTHELSDMRESVARNTSSPNAALDSLRDEFPWIIARNPNASAETLTILSGHQNVHVRLSVIGNPSATTEQLLECYKDEDKSVRAAVLNRLGNKLYLSLLDREYSSAKAFAGADGAESEYQAFESTLKDAVNKYPQQIVLDWSVSHVESLLSNKETESAAQRCKEFYETFLDKAIAEKERLSQIADFQTVPSESENNADLIARLYNRTFDEKSFEGNNAIDDLKLLCLAGDYKFKSPVNDMWVESEDAGNPETVSYDAAVLYIHEDGTLWASGTAHFRNSGETEPYERRIDDDAAELLRYELLSEEDKRVLQDNALINLVTDSHISLDEEGTPHVEMSEYQAENEKLFSDELRSRSLAELKTMRQKTYESALKILAQRKGVDIEDPQDLNDPKKLALIPEERRQAGAATNSIFDKYENAKTQIENEGVRSFDGHTTFIPGTVFLTERQPDGRTTRNGYELLKNIGDAKDATVQGLNLSDPGRARELGLYPRSAQEREDGVVPDTSRNLKALSALRRTLSKVISSPVSDILAVSRAFEEQKTSRSVDINTVSNVFDGLLDEAQRNPNADFVLLLGKEDPLAIYNNGYYDIELRALFADALQRHGLERVPDNIVLSSHWAQSSFFRHEKAIEQRVNEQEAVTVGGVTIMQDPVPVKSNSEAYHNRTVVNAEQSDVTIAFAVSFSTSGEKLTKTAAGGDNLCLNPEIGPDTVINVYAGSGENPELSNFSCRPFTHKIGDSSINFYSVEQAFQYYKTFYSPAPEAQLQAIRQQILTTTGGGHLRRAGRSVPDLDMARWEAESPAIMETLIRESFTQNPSAAQALLDTGDATLAHVQDIGRWKQLFPDILMKVRGELAQAISKKNKYVDIEIKPDNLINDAAKAAARRIIDTMKAKHLPLEDCVANIAGNGAYTLAQNGVDAARFDRFVASVLYYVVNDADDKVTFKQIRSGCQTGADQAGIKAAVRLNIPALAYLPYGFITRNAQGKTERGLRHIIELFDKGLTLEEMEAARDTARQLAAELPEETVSFDNVSGVNCWDGRTSLLADQKDVIFLFEGNTEGRHGQGNARLAAERFGALQGKAEGLQVNEGMQAGEASSYAIPVKDLAKAKALGLYTEKDTEWAIIEARLLQHYSLNASFADVLTDRNPAERSVPPQAIVESWVRALEVMDTMPDRRFVLNDNGGLRVMDSSGYLGGERLAMLGEAIRRHGHRPDNLIIPKAYARGIGMLTPQSAEELAEDNRFSVTRMLSGVVNGSEEIDGLAVDDGRFESVSGQLKKSIEALANEQAGLKAALSSPETGAAERNEAKERLAEIKEETESLTVTLEESRYIALSGDSPVRVPGAGGEMKDVQGFIVMKTPTDDTLERRRLDESIDKMESDMLQAYKDRVLESRIDKLKKDIEAIRPSEEAPRGYELTDSDEPTFRNGAQDIAVDRQKALFLLGGADLEMSEIRKMLDRYGVPYIDKGLGWGASVNDYRNEIEGAPEGVTVYGIELSEEGAGRQLPGNYSRIDHHGKLSDRESSLIQVADILGVDLSREQQLVAINDSEYITGLMRSGASMEEISEIRRRDRASQGITEEMDKAAMEAVAKAETFGDDWAVVRTPDTLGKWSLITDSLYGTKNILIYNGNELGYYGPAAHLLGENEPFASLSKAGKAYYGGSPESGYFGISDGGMTAEQYESAAALIRYICKMEAADRSLRNVMSNGFARTLAESLKVNEKEFLSDSTASLERGRIAEQTRRRDALKESFDTAVSLDLGDERIELASLDDDAVRGLAGSMRERRADVIEAEPDPLEPVTLTSRFSLVTDDEGSRIIDRNGEPIHEGVLTESPRVSHGIIIASYIDDRNELHNLKAYDTDGRVYHGKVDESVPVRKDVKLESLGGRIITFNRYRDPQFEKCPNYVYIGRSRANEPENPLHNPFTHKDGTRAEFKVATVQESVERFDAWFDEQYAGNPAFRKAFDEQIYEPFKRGEDVYLGCWCKGQYGTADYDSHPCHGDVLANKARIKLSEELRNNPELASQLLAARRKEAPAAKVTLRSSGKLDIMGNDLFIKDQADWTLSLNTSDSLFATDGENPKAVGVFIDPASMSSGAYARQTALDIMREAKVKGLSLTDVKLAVTGFRQAGMTRALLDCGAVKDTHAAKKLTGRFVASVMHFLRENGATIDHVFSAGNAGAESAAIIGAARLGIDADIICNAAFLREADMGNTEYGYQGYRSEFGDYLPKSKVDINALDDTSALSQEEIDEAFENDEDRIKRLTGKSSRAGDEDNEEERAFDDNEEQQEKVKAVKPVIIFSDKKDEHPFIELSDGSYFSAKLDPRRLSITTRTAFSVEGKDPVDCHLCTVAEAVERLTAALMEGRPAFEDEQKRREFIYQNAVMPVVSEWMRQEKKRGTNVIDELKSSVSTLAEKTDDGIVVVTCPSDEMKAAVGRAVCDSLNGIEPRTALVRTIDLEEEARRAEIVYPEVDFSRNDTVVFIGLNKRTSVEMQSILPKGTQTVIKLDAFKSGEADKFQKAVQGVGAQLMMLGAKDKKEPLFGLKGEGQAYEAALDELCARMNRGERIVLAVSPADLSWSNRVKTIGQDLLRRGVNVLGVQTVSSGNADVVEQRDIILKAIRPFILEQGDVRDIHFDKDGKIHHAEGNVVFREIHKHMDVTPIIGRDNFNNPVKVVYDQTLSQATNLQNMAKTCDIVINFGGTIPNEAFNDGESRPQVINVFNPDKGSDENGQANGRKARKHRHLSTDAARLLEPDYAQTIMGPVLDEMSEIIANRSFADPTFDPARHGLRIGITGMSDAEYTMKEFIRKVSEKEIQMNAADTSKHTQGAVSDNVRNDENTLVNGTKSGLRRNEDLRPAGEDDFYLVDAGTGRDTWFTFAQNCLRTLQDYEYHDDSGREFEEQDQKRDRHIPFSVVTDGDNGIGLGFIDASSSLGWKTEMRMTRDAKQTLTLGNNPVGEVIGKGYGKRPSEKLTIQDCRALAENRLHLGLRNKVTREELIEKAQKFYAERYDIPKQEGALGLDDRQLMTLRMAGFSNGDIITINEMTRNIAVPDNNELADIIQNYAGTDEEYRTLDARMAAARENLSKYNAEIDAFGVRMKSIVKIAQEVVADPLVSVEDKFKTIVERAKSADGENKTPIPKHYYDYLTKRFQDDPLPTIPAWNAYKDEACQKMYKHRKRLEKQLETADINLESYKRTHLVLSADQLDIYREQADELVKHNADNGYVLCSVNDPEYPQRLKDYYGKEVFGKKKFAVTLRRNGTLSAGTPSEEPGLLNDPQAVVRDAGKDEGFNEVMWVGSGDVASRKDIALEVDKYSSMFFYQGDMTLSNEPSVCLLGGNDSTEQAVREAKGAAEGMDGLVMVASIEPSNLSSFSTTSGSSADNREQKGRWARNAVNAAAAEHVSRGEKGFFVVADAESIEANATLEKNAENGGCNITEEGIKPEKQKKRTEQKEQVELPRRLLRAKKVGVAMSDVCLVVDSMTQNAPLVSAPINAALCVYALGYAIVEHNTVKAFQRNDAQEQALPKGLTTVQPGGDGIKEVADKARELSPAEQERREEAKAAEERNRKPEVKITAPNYASLQAIHYGGQVHVLVDPAYENITSELKAVYGDRLVLHDATDPAVNAQLIRDRLFHKSKAVPDIEARLEDPDSDEMTVIDTFAGYTDLMPETQAERPQNETIYFSNGRLYDLSNVPDGFPYANLLSRAQRENECARFEKIYSMCEDLQQRYNAHLHLSSPVHTAATHLELDYLQRSIHVMKGNDTMLNIFVDNTGRLKAENGETFMSALKEHAEAEDRILGKNYRFIRDEDIDIIFKQVETAVMNNAENTRIEWGLLTREEHADIEEKINQGWSTVPLEPNADLAGGLLDSADPFGREEAYVLLSDIIAIQEEKLEQAYDDVQKAYTEMNEAHAEMDRVLGESLLEGDRSVEARRAYTAAHETFKEFLTRYNTRRRELMVNRNLLDEIASGARVTIAGGTALSILHDNVRALHEALLKAEDALTGAKAGLDKAKAELDAQKTAEAQEAYDKALAARKDAETAHNEGMKKLIACQKDISVSQKMFAELYEGKTVDFYVNGVKITSKVRALSPKELADANFKIDAGLAEKRIRDRFKTERTLERQRPRTAGRSLSANEKDLATSIEQNKDTLAKLSDERAELVKRMNGIDEAVAGALKDNPEAKNRALADRAEMQKALASIGEKIDAVTDETASMESTLSNRLNNPEPLPDKESLSPDGKRTATLAAADILQTQDIDSTRHILTVPGGMVLVNDPAYDQDGNLIGCSAMSGTYAQIKHIKGDYWMVRLSDGRMNIMKGADAATGRMVLPQSVNQIYYARESGCDCFRVLVDGKQNLFNARTGQYVLKDEFSNNIHWLKKDFYLVEARETDGKQAFMRKSEDEFLYAKTDKKGKYLLDKEGRMIFTDNPEEGRKIPMYNIVCPDGSMLLKDDRQNPAWYTIDEISCIKEDRDGKLSFGLKTDGSWKNCEIKADEDSYKVVVTEVITEVVSIAEERGYGLTMN